MDEDSFDLIGYTHSKEIQPTCKVSFFDGAEQWEQRAGLQLAGAGSRWSALKSYELKTGKKWGGGSFVNSNLLETDVKEYKALKLRTTSSLYHRRCPNFVGLAHNAFMTLFGRGATSKIDYQETRQVVAFVNGDYQGIYDLTETANLKYIKSKYGLGESRVNYCKLLADGWSFGKQEDSLAFHTMWEGILEAATLPEVERVFALDNLLDYYLCEVYIQNGDWPTNNCVLWREMDGGKWRFILTDFDWAGLNVGADNLYHLQSAVADTIFLKSVFQKLSKFSRFKNRFADRAFVACATYLRPDRVRSLVDSLASNVRDEIPYQSQLFVQMCDSFDMPDEERSYYDDWEASVDELANWGFFRNEFLYERIQKYLGNRSDLVSLSILADSAFYFNEELSAEAYDGLYFRDKAVSLHGPGRESMYGTARYHMNDGTLLEEPFYGTFVIPDRATRAEISVEGMEDTGLGETLADRRRRGGGLYDLLGRPAAGRRPQGVVVNERGEKTAARE